MKAVPGLTLVCLAAGAVSVWAQSGQSSSARDLLSDVAATYRNLNSFEWAALSTVSLDSADYMPTTAPFVGAFRRPHSMRIEWHGKGPPGDNVSITNGKDVRLYYRKLNGFCHPDPKLYLQRTPHEAMSAPGSSLPYEHILDGLRSARLVGKRILKVGTDDVTCLVVTAVYSPSKSGWTGSVRTAPITYWIDAETKIVAQQTFQTAFKVPRRSQPRTETFTTTLLRYRLNPELPDSRFTFRPPARVLERPCSAFSGGG
jgi:outer membrane lipoprotein-sorting protein